MRKHYPTSFALLLAMIFTITSASAQIVISQVYGGGGNSGATLKNDFVELFNRGTSPVDITGWSVQYASAAGTSWQVTTLSGTIQPGKYYLVRQAQGAGGTVDLPTPDATGSIAMSGTSGKVALVNNTTSLSGGTGCPLPNASIVDYVGYGTANCFEGGAATGTLSNTTAALRNNNGCTDTDNNNSDFTVAAPNPRNSASPVSYCFTPVSKVVISQVYGGGGNSGAPYTNDFIELFNSGNVPFDLTGYSVQYASASGTGNFGANSGQLVVLPSITLQPGQYFLVQNSSGGANGVALPTPDATGTINMSGTNGKVALAQTTTSLLCNGGSTPCAPAQTALIVDLVGYGSANYFEGSGATSATSNTTAALRNNNGCTDTDNNNSDFTIAAPAPRNTSSPFNLCSGAPVFISTASPLPAGQVNALYNTTIAAAGGAQPYSFSISAGALPNGLSIGINSGEIAGTPTTATIADFTVKVTDANGGMATKEFSLTINPEPCNPPTHTIAQIQGNGNVSPLVGQVVTFRGIVTGVKSNGFFAQAPDAETDADPATSEGIFVFTGNAVPAAAVKGNLLCITGTVAEFAASGNPAGFSLTEITTPSVSLLSSGNPLPSAITLGVNDNTPTGGFFQLEPYEGMLVTIPSLTVVAPNDEFISEANATATSSGFFNGVITGIDRPFREPGFPVSGILPVGSPANVPLWDENPEIIAIGTDAGGGTLIEAAAGDVFEMITGPLDYSRKNYAVIVDKDNPPTRTIQNTGAQPVMPSASSDLTVASFNMERFYDDVNDPDVGDVALTTQAFNNRLNKGSRAIRDILRTPDVVAVVEMENLNALQALANRINADALLNGEPDPQYMPYLVEGNDVGGIDVGFLVRANRVTVSSVMQYGKTTTYLNPDNGQEELLNDRPPLVLQATFAKEGCATPYPFIVIANHLRSLNGADDPVNNRVRAKRNAQAEFLAQLIQSFQENNPKANIISVGDYNAFEFNDGLTDLIGTVKGTPTPPNEVVLAGALITNPALTNLIDQVPPALRYTYEFGASAQSLDHALVSQHLLPMVSKFQIAHLSADYPASFRNDPNRPERLSDHEALVATITFADDEAPLAVCKPATVTLANGSASITAADVDGGSTDNCGITSLSVSPSSFDCSNIGSNEVTLTVTDAAGLSSSCKAIVTVVGAIPSCSIEAIPENNVYTGGVATNIYLGYGPQSVTLDANPTGGSSFTYSWSGNGSLSCTTCEMPVFTPASEGVYLFTVTVTNNYGCTTTCSITICVLDVRVPGTKGKKVYLCHSPVDNTGNTQTLEVNTNGVAEHLMDHPEDKLGNCGESPCNTSGRYVKTNTKHLPIDGSSLDLAVAVAPNPSTGAFTLSIRSGTQQPVSLRILDAAGRPVMSQLSVVPNSTLQTGEQLHKGLYFAEVRQGNQTVVIKLLKL